METMAKRAIILFVLFAFIAACKPNGIQSEARTPGSTGSTATITPVSLSETTLPKASEETAAGITPVAVQMGALINSRTGFIHAGETHIYTFIDEPSLGYDYFAFELTSDDTVIKPVLSLKYEEKIIDENSISVKGGENILPSIRLPVNNGKYYCIDPAIYPEKISVEIMIKDTQGRGAGNYTLKLISLSSVTDANDCTFIFGADHSVTGSDKGDNPQPTPVRIVVNPFTFEESFYTARFQNADWSHSNLGWLVTGKTLFSYGEEGDTPGVYTVTHRIPLLFNAPDYLHFEFTGKLLAEGKPQPGQSIDVSLGGYDIHLEIRTAKVPSSTSAISLNLNDGTTINQAILAPVKPNRDMFYILQATRGMGKWSFYVNKSLVGTAEDSLNTKEFSELSLTTTGAAAINHMQVSNQP
ncbi:MAG: hypothetical protein ACM3PY_11470 [Omnitrophica WOR_2 bacterium]